MKEYRQKTYHSLQESLANAKPLYLLPNDPLIPDVLIPAMGAASAADVMMGYFNSSSFREIAPGLATFLRNTESPLRMVVSPYLSEPDYQMVLQDKNEQANLMQKILINSIPDEDDLVQHTLECLAWLIDQSRLILKIAVMRSALFHSKVWLFRDDSTQVALHGSINLTTAGLSRNHEQIALARKWTSEESEYTITRLRKEFDLLWHGGNERCFVMTLNEAIERKIVSQYKSDRTPDEGTIDRLWRKARGEELSNRATLMIPGGIEFVSGNFKHQGQAVRAWESANRKGILEMATGSGKTITALICATRLQEISSDGLLVVIAAPYRPLIEQWCEEVRKFGVVPKDLSNSGGLQARRRNMLESLRALRMGYSKTEVFVVTHRTLSTSEFNRTCQTWRGEKLLIADECHHLNTDSFIKNQPSDFDYRLGLSATPDSQYEESTTTFIHGFLGEICFRYTLGEAIGKCLTQYDYHIHLCELTPPEMDEWRDLTRKIILQRLRNNEEDPNEYIETLLRKRRLVLENAESKTVVFDSLLDSLDLSELRHALVYATDKNPVQLESINSLLEERNILYHQLTAEETANRNNTNEILSLFQDGVYRVLTAKRVLDEGVNIPQIRIAFLLASTTMHRQWVQRRGRLLRPCPAIDKTHAEIHDFVAIPSNDGIYGVDVHEARIFLRSEYERVWEFTRHCRNLGARNSPLDAVRRLQELTNEFGKD